MKDYYVILGVRYAASQFEIKRAYRRLAVQYHPDKNPAPQAEEMFKEINEAYDVLSDLQKKTFYDLKRQNPYEEVFQQTEPQPQHRDPRYRGRGTVRPQKSESQQTYEMMEEYIRYVRWLCWISLVITTLFFVDYILPYQIKKETLVEEYTVYGRRGSFSHIVYVTESGKKIRKRHGVNVRMDIGKMITYEQTWMYSIVMSVSDETGKDRTGHVYYSALVTFPGALWVIACLGVLFRKRVDFYFNISIVSGIMLLIVLYLMMSS